MIRYGGHISYADREEFLRFTVNEQLCFQRVVEGSGGEFYIVYFTSRASELIFRLKYPKMVKEIDDTIS